jgi:hypothetical protein
LKRTGTLKVDVQFIPWLPPSKDRVLSGPAVLDFSLSKDGITQTLAKDLELKFRRLPKGASPGVLDWAELTSQLKTRFKSSKKLKLKLKPREAVSPASSQTYDMVVDSNNEGEANPDKERKIMIDPGETGEDVKKSKEFVDLMETVTTTNKLISKAEEMRDAVVGFVEKKMEGNGDNIDETRERHHRLSSGIIEGFNLSQICSLDNAETDTQASVWADFNRKQVGFTAK